MILGLPMRFTAHAQLNTDLNDKWTLTPELYFSNLSPARQVQLHAWAGYKLPPKEGKDIKLNAGLGYRVSDSAQLLLGVDYGDIRAQLGYDFTLSQLGQIQQPSRRLRTGGLRILRRSTKSLW